MLLILNSTVWPATILHQADNEQDDKQNCVNLSTHHHGPGQLAHTDKQKHSAENRSDTKKNKKPAKFVRLSIPAAAPTKHDERKYTKFNSLTFCVTIKALISLSVIDIESSRLVVHHVKDQYSRLEIMIIIKIKHEQ